MMLSEKIKQEQMKVKYSEAQIKQRITELAKEIENSYNDDKPILCVCVLKGAVMFFADLMREIKVRDIFYDFLTISSYKNEVNSSGNVKLLSNITESVNGRHVLIVEDIVDTGYTLQFLNQYFSSLEAFDVKTVCLLDKPLARKVDISADFVAFTLTDTQFVIGYGLDYAQSYRNYKDIWAVEV